MARSSPEHQCWALTLSDAVPNSEPNGHGNVCRLSCAVTWSCSVKEDGARSLIMVRLTSPPRKSSLGSRSSCPLVITCRNRGHQHRVS